MEGRGRLLCDRRQATDLGDRREARGVLVGMSVLLQVVGMSVSASDSFELDH